MAAVENLNAAITMLAQGFDDAYTAASLQVPPDTIRNIRKNYAADIQREKDALPLKGFTPLTPVQTHQSDKPILRVYPCRYTGLSRRVYGKARHVEVLIDEPNRCVAVKATENTEGTWPVSKGGLICRVALAQELQRLAGCQKGHWLGRTVGDAYVFDLKEGADA
jgi:hypothetical protein